MGGHAAGDVASSLAVHEARDAYYRAVGDSIDRALEGAIETANRQVFAAGHGARGRDQMGSTLTAAVIYGRQAVVGHVGDSRCYLIRDGQIRQLTRDHSWVADEVEAGALTPEQARTHPRRNIITRALGLQPEVDIDIYRATVDHGSALVLCSDGLHGPVRDEEILASAGSLPPQEAVDRLVSLANQRGGPDNISVVVVKAVAASEGETGRRADASTEAERVARSFPPRGRGGESSHPVGPARDPGRAIPDPRPDVSGADEPGAPRSIDSAIPARAREPSRGSRGRGGDGRASAVLVGVALALLVVGVALVWWLVFRSFGVGPLGRADSTPAQAAALAAPNPRGLAVLVSAASAATATDPVSGGSTARQPASDDSDEEGPPPSPSDRRRRLAVVQDDAAVRVAPVPDAPVTAWLGWGEEIAGEADVNGEGLSGNFRWHLVRLQTGSGLARGFMHSSVVRPLLEE